jgi:hypothetical protein
MPKLNTKTIHDTFIIELTMNAHISNILQQCNDSYDKYTCVYDYIDLNSELLKKELYDTNSFPTKAFITLLWTTLYYIHSRHFSKNALDILNHVFHLLENEFAITGIININLEENPDLNTIVSADDEFFNKFIVYIGNKQYLQLSNSLLVFYITRINEKNAAQCIRSRKQTRKQKKGGARRKKLKSTICRNRW